MAAQHREAAHGQGVALAPESAPAPDSTTSPADTTTRPPLSCQRIIDAAVRFVDDNALDELSMRRLGGELGVEAMSLYRYFPSKAALLDAVAARLLADLALPDPDDDDWEAQVHAFCRSFRTITRRHPNLVPLLASMDPEDQLPSSIHARMVELWRRAGLDEATAENTQRALAAYVSGSTQWHRACPSAAADTDFEFGLDLFLQGIRARLLTPRVH